MEKWKRGTTFSSIGKESRLPPVGTRSVDQYQVTAPGATVDYIGDKMMASKVGYIQSTMSNTILPLSSSLSRV